MELFRQSAINSRRPARYGRPFAFIASLLDAGNRLPLLMQSQRSDCGLVCLAMVAGFHGRHIDDDWIRTRRLYSERGITVSGITAAATGLNLQARGVRLEPEELQQLSVPAILHWDMDHFVVLKCCRRKDVVVHDPATGKRCYSYGELDMHFTGVALELWPDAGFTTSPAPQQLSVTDLFDNDDGFKLRALKLFVLSLLIQLISLATPFYVQLAIDDGLASRDPDLLLVVTAFFLLLVLMKTALTWWRGLALMGLSYQVGFQMSSKVFRHLLNLPEQYFSRRHMGDIVSRFNSLENIRRLVTGELITVVVDGLFSLATLYLLFLFSPQLALISFGFVLSGAVFRLLVISLEREKKQEVLQFEAGQKSAFMENLRAITTIKLFAMEEPRFQSWINRQADFINSAVRLDRFRNTTLTVQNLIYGLDYVVTIYLGSRLVYLQSMSIGQLMAFIFLKQHFITAIAAMIPKLVELKLMRLDLERVGDITRYPAATRRSCLPILAHDNSATVIARDIHFSYVGSGGMLIRGLNFFVEAGSMLAISGPSGCGKTTLVKLLVGLLEPSIGRILIGNRVCQPESIDQQGRSRMAAVLHDEELLAGSLLYNITLDGDANNRDRLLAVCRCAGILDDIIALPMQFATSVGEMGSSLSAGQVKRILLARALYRQPNVLILDETLSNLDGLLAAAIVRDIRSRGITLILVTHNIQLMEMADRHLVMENCQSGSTDHAG